jgi:hypothetical protein
MWLEETEWFTRIDERSAFYSSDERNTYVCIYMHACMYECMCVYVRMHVYVRMYVHMYV